MPIYPSKFLLPAMVLEELIECEWGIFEDAGCPTKGHHVNTLKRHRTMIVVNNQTEADQIYWAICTGTFALKEKDGPQGQPEWWLKWGKAITYWLRPLCSEEVVRANPTCEGY